MTIEIYCDGACIGNPGPGGYGGIVLFADRVFELGGFAAQTTNNRMEMTAALKSLEALTPEQGDIVVFSDSQYVVKGITEWIAGWVRKGWKNAAGQPVLNQDLWQALSVQQKRFGPKLKWQYVKGHAGIPGNERADQIATTYAQKQTCELYEGPRKGYLYA